MSDNDASVEGASRRVFALVRRIDKGRVMSYGQVGQLLDPMVNARMVGRILAFALADVPWWRVVGVNGDLLIHKRAPHLALEQRDRLLEEGVKFIDDRVDMAAYRQESAFID